MDLCNSNPDEATKIINNLNINESDKKRILSKYIKESKRLFLDLKQEREIKLIAIKHKLQNDLQDSELSKDLLNYVENAIPSADFSNQITHEQNYIHNQTININPQIISKVEGIVCNELNGDIHFNVQDEELSKLFEKYSKNLAEKTNLQTALHELIDRATSKEKKRSSWQKIYGFLGKVSNKIGDVAVSILVKYIEQKMEEN